MSEVNTATPLPNEYINRLILYSLFEQLRSTITFYEQF